MRSRDRGNLGQQGETPSLLKIKKNFKLKKRKLLNKVEKNPRKKNIIADQDLPS